MEGILLKCKNNAQMLLDTVYENKSPFLDNTAKSGLLGLKINQ